LKDHSTLRVDRIKVRSLTFIPRQRVYRFTTHAVVDESVPHSANHTNEILDLPSFY
jgi:hypothetical protein